MAPAVFTAMPAFTSGAMQEAHDGHLTWETGADFDFPSLLRNVEAKDWDWDADRAGKTGAAATRYPQTYYSLQADQRCTRAKPLRIQYSFETQTWKMRAAYVKMSAGFIVDGKSAQLPSPANSNIPPPRKWSPLEDTWVPRNAADPPPHRLRAKFKKPSWHFWG